VNRVDAVVVGAGPNGLAAAIELARHGRSVHLVERSAEVGGGAHTAELTLPGFKHDLCSAVHPLAVGSPFFSSLALERHGLELVFPEVQLAHPLDGGDAVAVRCSLDMTATALGEDDRAYRSLVGPFADGWDRLTDVLLGPIPRLPRAPLLALRFAVPAVLPASALARIAFNGKRARALLAGMAAHSMQPLAGAGTGAFGLVLMTLAHACGWPVIRGGSGEIARAMRAELESLGGTVQTGFEVRSLDDLPELQGARAILFDLTPRQFLAICGRDQGLPTAYQRELRRFRHGPGVFKVDYALSGPVPWTAAACRAAGTVHLGGTLEEISISEAAVAAGRHPDRPYVLLSQPSVIDGSRAPEGNHTLWAYCHVPNGSPVDMTGAIEAQIERFAPGFSQIVLARATHGPAELEAINPNLIGGDIGGGASTLWQTFARPAPRLSPYTTPNPRLFLCSSSTPPGGGVHGMCGHHAARAALSKVLG
jgi:phytoene dehydrogenase-like protein